MTGLSFPAPGLLAGAPRVAPWHWGCVVEDMQQAIEDWFRMGATACSPVCRLDGRTYDAEQKSFQAQTNDIAFLRLGGRGGVIELICPVDKSAQGPQNRFLAARPGLTHLALWCDSLPEAATHFLAQGARLVLAAPSARFDAIAAEHVTIDDLLSDSAACYLCLRGGHMVELNPAANHASLSRLWGDAIHQIVPPPAWA